MQNLTSPYSEPVNTSNYLIDKVAKANTAPIKAKITTGSFDTCSQTSINTLDISLKNFIFSLLVLLLKDLLYKIVALLTIIVNKTF